MATDLHARAIITAVDQLSGPLSKMAGRMQAFSAKMAAVGTAMASAGRGMTMAFTLPAGLAIREAVKFDSAMGDLAKVFMGTDEQLAATERQIKSFAREIPITQEGLAKLYTAANQANIPLKEQAEFVKLASEFLVAFDVTADEAALALARLKASQGLTTDGLRELAGVMNIVANNSAATEAEMLDLVSRIGALGKVVGGEEAVRGILAVGGAAVSMGVDAERAATGLRNAMLELSAGETATKSTVEALERLSLTATETAKALTEDTIGTFRDVFQRIADLPKEFQLSTLNQLFGKRAVDALAPLLGNLKELDRILALAEDRQKAMTSVAEENAARMKRLEPRLAILRNHLAGVALAITDQWMPAMERGMKAATEFFESLQDKPALIQAMAKSLGVLALAGPGLWLVGSALKSIAGTLAFIGRVGLMKLGAWGVAIAAMVQAGRAISEAWPEDLAPRWAKVQEAGSKLADSLARLAGIAAPDGEGWKAIQDWFDTEAVKAAANVLDELASAMNNLRGVIEKPLEFGNWAKLFGLAPSEPGQAPTRPPGFETGAAIREWFGIPGVKEWFAHEPKQFREGGSVIPQGGPSVPIVPRSSLSPLEWDESKLAPLIRDLGEIEATVKQPIPVEVGPVELKGQGHVQIDVKVHGGQVVGMSSRSSGHIAVDTGTSMDDMGTKP